MTDPRMTWTEELMEYGYEVEYDQADSWDDYSDAVFYFVEDYWDDVESFDTLKFGEVIEEYEVVEVYRKQYGEGVFWDDFDTIPDAQEFIERQKAAHEYWYEVVTYQRLADGEGGYYIERDSE